jgi:hypothetical protein
MRELFSPLVDRVVVLVRSLGPYAAIELLLPGGSMGAALLVVSPEGEPHSMSTFNPPTDFLA